MKIWVVTIGEPLPIDSGNQRLHRSGTIAKILAERGHEVTWWTSSFNHVLKTDRTSSDKEINWTDNLRLILMYAPGYARNVSIDRLTNHLALAKKFRRLAEKETPPDIILASLPDMFLAEEAAEYGRNHHVPTVLDIRDLWPDIFLDLFPGLLRPLAKISLMPAFNSTRKACRQATAIIGCTDPFVSWGLKYAGRRPTVLDKGFFMGYSAEAPTENEIEQAEKYWDNLGIGREKDEFIISFFGYIGRYFDIETVIKAARILGDSHRFRFVICGTGEKVSHYQQLARGCDNVVFPGWANFPQIWVLLRRSSLGLAPYVTIDNFTLNMPNKPAEYFSAGIPVITSLQGVLGNLLTENDTGLTYEAGNAADLADKLILLNRDKAKWETMSRNASVVYDNLFRAEKVYGDLAEHLDLVRHTAIYNQNSEGKACEENAF